MTEEELRAHCEKQVKMCEEWAKGNGREPSGRIYEEHKLILDLINELQDKSYELWKESYEEEHLRNIRLEEKIKALEQQPSNEDVQRVVDYLLKPKIKPTCDDCVSRKQAKIDVIPNSLYTSEQVIALLDNLLPVTPTHGTCKDCTNYVVGALDEEICIRGHELIHKDFYCADFEKRGLIK